MRAVALVLTLLLFWLVLSGHYTLWLIGAGIVSSIAIAAFARRMAAIDDEGHPVEWLVGAITYWPWLLWEIVKATWDVVKIILSPRLDISPTLIRVKASQKSSVGLNIYANSITLTPGTISAALSSTDSTILVHAVTQDGAEATAEGTMDRRVTAYEGRAK
ncbi:MAG: Na+/H+ antiporter subunit E [Rhodobiaceae bacterium]|nr:Na+/H+ antiporter subunit E [Rhodobiaceae bacterium]MCC0054694.1 Na+/H+ antiporter subunit E [Rhodobiaceae bacterium]